jgi:NAD(P) transhydrogenase subunit alpha
MRIASVLENKNKEKRIAITPEIAKKYITSGFEVILSKTYGDHLGFRDHEYEALGVKLSADQNEILNKGDIIIQLGLLSDSNLSQLKENQILVGILDPYSNKKKFDDLVKRKINSFSLELLPRITRAQSMDILSYKQI